LASCARCQAELHDILQLKMATDQLRQHRYALTSFRRRQRLIAVAAVSACAAAAAVAAWWPRPEPLEEFLARSSERPILARLSPDAANVYRPYNVLLGKATSNGSEPFPAQAVAELQRRGDRAGEAALHLFTGSAQHAADALALAPRTPEIDNDRAV